MPNISRREFLRGALLGAGAIIAARFLSACGQPQTAIQPSPTIITPHPIPEPEKEVSKPPTSHPDIVVVRNGDPEAMVREAIEALGGMGRFVKKGANVIVKPNIGPAVRSYEYAATTNPWVVAGIVKLCLEAGAGRVRVMDKPFGAGPEVGYVKSGIKEMVEQAGGEMEIMSRFKFVATEIPGGRDVKKWDIYEDILKADVLINVPIAKHHSAARLTLGMKNLMGTINSAQMFHLNLQQRIADLSSRVRPSLTILDAVRILVDNGPTGGNLSDVRKLDTIVAGTDIVAVDSYGTTLFGLQPEDVTYIGIAASMGLGNNSLKSMTIKEINLGS